MKISIIIPTYKPKNYLWECLDSIKVQKFPKKDFEIVLVLNGCLEPWKTDIEKYISCHLQGFNVNFIQTFQSGVSNARNIALDVAKGDYITFLDDDDMVSPDFLQEMYKVVSGDTISICKPLGFKDNSKHFFEYSVSSVYNKFFSKGVVSPFKARKYFSGPCMKLISINIIQNRRYDIHFRNGEDSIFMFLISDKIKKVAFTPSNAIYYRRFRYGSAMTSNRTMKEITLNSLRSVFVYCKIYFKSPFKYNFLLFVTRILGAVHSTVVGVKKYN